MSRSSGWAGTVLIGLAMAGGNIVTPFPAHGAVGTSLWIPGERVADVGETVAASRTVPVYHARGKFVIAQVSETPTGEEQPGLIGRVTGFVDETQATASDRLIGFVESVDGFFGEDTESNIGNKSWARIRVDMKRPGDDDLEIDPTLKLRVVLPQSEERFRLLFSSEEEESSVVSSTGAVRTPSIASASGNDRNASLALRFIRTARDTSSVKFDLGIRQREGKIQYFGRVNATAEGEMVRRWHGRVSNNYYHYSRSGYENKLRFSMTRPIAWPREMVFKTSLGFSWRKGLKGAGIGEAIGFYADLNERTAIALEALAGYSTSLNGSKSKRYKGAEVRIRFRQNIWRPWFFYEIWPSVLWPSSNGYQQVYGGLLRIEMIIGRRK